MKKLFTLLLALSSIGNSAAQSTKILFIGNSYTNFGNLPQLVADVALSNGDSVIVDSYTPGGYTFQLHSTDANTLAKITSQQWDYVVLQEQSQRPSFSPAQVANEVLPYARTLDSLIHVNNPCTETVFYMTWGRKNGDASNCSFYPPVCTYEGMQARLRESYMLLAQLNNCTVAPVGAAWKLTRDQNPVFDLYNPDESHPSLHGSYLAACTIYSTIFHKSPVATSFISTLPQADADLLQDMAAATVTDSLDVWYQYGNIPVADFTYGTNGADVQFQDASLNASSWLWSFGDQTTSVLQSPLHTYAAAGSYVVTLQAATGCRSSSISDTVTVTTTGLASLSPECEKLWFDREGGVVRFDCQHHFDRFRCFAPDGRLVAEKFVDPGTGQLPLFLSVKGIYIAEFRSGSKVMRRLLPVF